MGDAAGVGRSKSRAYLHGQLHRFAQRQRSAVEPRPQRLALQQLEYHVRGPILGAYVVDRQDAGMIESSDGPSLLLEAPQAIGAGLAIGGDHFDGYVTAETGIARAIDLSHASSPEGTDDLVRAQTASRSEQHGARLRPDCAPEGRHRPLSVERLICQLFFRIAPILRTPPLNALGEDSTCASATHPDGSCSRCTPCIMPRRKSSRWADALLRVDAYLSTQPTSAERETTVEGHSRCERRQDVEGPSGDWLLR